MDTNAQAVHLVRVGGANSASGGADLAAAEEALVDFVEGPVVIGDDVRIGAHEEGRGVDTTFFETVDFVEKHVEVNHHAVADNRHTARAEDAAGQQVQRVFLVADDDRVASIVAAIEFDDVIDSTSE